VCVCVRARVRGLPFLTCCAGQRKRALSNEGQGNDSTVPPQERQGSLHGLDLCLLLRLAIKISSNHAPWDSVAVYRHLLKVQSESSAKKELADQKKQIKCEG
jgi:hypothetical protein